MNVFSAASVAAPFLQISPKSLAIPLDGTRGLTISCTDCVPGREGGRLEFLVDDPAVAAVQTDELFIFANPAITAVNVVGLAEGATVFRVRLYDGAGTVPILSAAASVSVLPAVDCPFELLARSEVDGADRLEVLRSVRDDVLMGDAAGRRLVGRFYEHVEETTSILLRRPRLFLEAREQFLSLFAIADNLAAGEPSLITREELGELTGFLRALEEEASPELRRALAATRTELSRGKMLRRFGVEVIGERR